MGEKRIRKNQIKFHVSDDELELLNQKVEEVNKAGNKISREEYLRVVSMGSGINIKVFGNPGQIETLIDNQQKLLNEMMKQGVNINQIAHALNGGFYQSADKELEQVKENYDKIFYTVGDFYSIFRKIYKAIDYDIAAYYNNKNNENGDE